MDTPAPDQLDLLRQARRASLMKVWASGSRRLSADERAEIADLIEPEATEPTPAAEPRAPALAESAYEATAEQIERWGKLYSTSRRPLYKWIAVGREKHDPCPLDHPTQMPLWWATNMKHRVPEKILAAARLAAAEAPPPAAVESSVPPSFPHSGDDLFTLVSLDFEAQVEQMRAEQARIQRQLDEARRGKLVDGALFVDQPAVESLLRQRLAIQEPLRKAEGDLTDWLLKREKLVWRDEVRSENNRLASAICNAVLRLVKNVRPQLAGKAVAEQDRIWTAETLACFSSLKAAKFTRVNFDELGS